MHRAHTTDCYRIRVGCHLDGRWTEWFDGLTVENLDDGQALIVSGPVDQSALQGLLAQIRNRNIELISLQRAGGDDHDHRH